MASDAKGRAMYRFDDLANPAINKTWKPGDVEGVA